MNDCIPVMECNAIIVKEDSEEWTHGVCPRSNLNYRTDTRKSIQVLVLARGRRLDYLFEVN